MRMGQLTFNNIFKTLDDWIAVSIFSTDGKSCHRSVVHII